MKRFLLLALVLCLTVLALPARADDTFDMQLSNFTLTPTASPGIYRVSLTANVLSGADAPEAVNWSLSIHTGNGQLVFADGGVWSTAETAKCPASTVCTIADICNDTCGTVLPGGGHSGACAADSTPCPGLPTGRHVCKCFDFLQNWLFYISLPNGPMPMSAEIVPSIQDRDPSNNLIQIN